MVPTRDQIPCQAVDGVLSLIKRVSGMCSSTKSEDESKRVDIQQSVESRCLCRGETQPRSLRSFLSSAAVDIDRDRHKYLRTW